LETGKSYLSLNGIGALLFSLLIPNVKRYPFPKSQPTHISRSFELRRVISVLLQGQSSPLLLTNSRSELQSLQSLNLPTFKRAQNQQTPNEHKYLESSVKSSKHKHPLIPVLTSICSSIQHTSPPPYVNLLLTVWLPFSTFPRPTH